MAAPLVKMIGGLLLRKVIKEVAPKVIDKVTEKVLRQPPKTPSSPSENPRKVPPMNSAIVGALRHIVQLGAGALVAKGVIDPAGAELVIGAAMSVAALGWYLIERRFAR